MTTPRLQILTGGEQSCCRETQPRVYAYALDSARMLQEMRRYRIRRGESDGRSTVRNLG